MKLFGWGLAYCTSEKIQESHRIPYWAQMAGVATEHCCRHCLLPKFFITSSSAKRTEGKKSIWEMKSKTATTDRLSRQNGTCQPVIEVTDVYIKIGEMVGNHCIRKRSYHCKTTQKTSVWSRHPVAEELEKGRFTYDIMRKSIPNTERGIQALWVCWPGGGGC